MKNYDLYSDLTTSDPLSALKTFCVNYFINQKIQCMYAEDKNNIVKWFLKLRSNKHAKYLPIIKIVKRMKLRNTAGSRSLL